ncbi:MAG: peptidylprolyl isomerase [Acidobacteriota bacterium]
MQRTAYLRAGMAAAAGVLACAVLAAQNAPVVVDRVVAVVNNQPILLSDVRNEVRLAALEPRSKEEGEPTEQNALDDLISRALIRQQIREEDVQAAQPNPEQVEQRLAGLRRELPECVHLHCSTEAGWQAFLKEHALTEAEVEHYLRMRMEVLAFIEDRFRQGIRIPQEDVEKYYRETLLPQYPKGERAPPLKNVEPRIEEILLEQRVNELFGAWLDNLRKQGDVEVLDPALKVGGDGASGNGGSQ